MCFRLIEAEKAQHPVSLLCSVLGVSRAGYYAWKRRPLSERRLRDLELLALIKEIHRESEGSYGWPRMHAELRHRGVKASRKRVARLMREAGLSGLITRRRGKTTIRVPGVRPTPDLVGRDFQAAGPNRLWAADLTEIATWEGKLYLAVVLDCFSRRCVGWAMADHMRAELVVEALEMAVWQRKPTPGLVSSFRPGLAVHGAALRPALPPGRDRPLDGRSRLRARQRRLRELLRQPQEGAHPATLLADAPRAPDRRVRLDRGLVQPPQAALHPRLPLTRGCPIARRT
jgi:hypothetical protein